MAGSRKKKAGVEDRKHFHASTESRSAELEAQLETYKKSLTEIYELYDRKIEELSLIRRISDALRTPLDLEGLCRETIETVAHEVAPDRLALLLLDQDRERLRIKASYDAGVEASRFHSDRESQPLTLDQGPAGQAARTAEPVLIPSAGPEEDPLGPSDRPVSLLFLPLVVRDKTVGVLSLTRPAAQPFTEADLRVLTIIADQAATALANVQLFNDLAAANIRLQESEREARRTSLYLENLLEAANDVIFTLDLEGRITYVNRQIEEWGYSKEALHGRFLDDLTADRRETGALTGRLAAAGRQVLEAAFRTVSGQRREVLLSTSPIAGASGSGSGWLVLARDVTERTQLEKQLFQSEKLAGIGLLAAGVAHEIGNPLSAISGYTQILQNAQVSPEEAQEYLGAIESQTARIQRIIEELLSYSRPSAGQRLEIDLAEAVPTILTMLTGQGFFKNIEVRFDPAAGPPPVVMDRDHLAQVIINIALNAAQAMPAGGVLTVSLKETGDKVQIRLTDTGPGIPPEIQGRIFDPFFTSKPAGQGTGLGLAICHRIVDHYHGSLEVESRPGQGASFIVTLPAANLERA